MVRTSAIIVAAFALAPVLAAPLTEDVAEDLSLRSLDDSDYLDLEARKFKLGKAFKKFKGLAKTAIKVAYPAAGLVMRDVGDGAELDLEARTVHSGVVHHAHSDPSPRAIDNVDDPLSARTLSKPHRLGHKIGQRKKVGGRGVRGHKGRGNGKGKGRGRGKGKGKGKKGHGRGKGKRHGKGRKGAKGHAGKKHSRHPRSIEEFEDDIAAREFDEELEIRDLDFETAIAELVQRELLDAMEDLEIRDLGDADLEGLVARDESVSLDELD